jgi:hypothetical protein
MTISERVMVTSPSGKRPDLSGLQCPVEWNVDFARRLLAALGEDVAPVRDSWCWANFKLYAHHAPTVLAWLEQATTGDPAWEAYWIARHLDRGMTERAMRVAEQATTGDPGGAAYSIACDLDRGLAERAMRVAEKRKEAK